MAAKPHTISLTIAHGFARWILYPLCYYIIRYRRRVVHKNLTMAFPNKSSQEIQHIEKSFYRHFSNMIMEILIGGRFTQEDILQFFTCHQMEEMEAQCRAHNGCFIMMGHFINWEWQSIVAVPLTKTGLDCGIIYKKLYNPFFDHLMKRLRERRGGFFIEMNRLLRIIVERKKTDKPIPTYYAMLADQRPNAKAKAYWTNLLGIETDVYIGTEQLALKYQLPVYYAYIRILPNGHYDVTFESLYIPQQETALPSGEITERFTNILERNIQEVPDRWLWTHNRFSHRKPTNE